MNVDPQQDDADLQVWPAWATEQVQVVPPDAAWQDRGDRQRRQLDAALRPWLVAPVQHVGSTAVPALPAKPIVDLQAAVGDLECASDIADSLTPRGWHLVPPALDARPWRRFLVQVMDGHRVAHLHLLHLGGGRWSDQLTFREALRADSGLTHRYGVLKLALAGAHADDREAYTAAKADFIRGVLDKARPV